jgi:hypothetical protein
MRERSREDVERMKTAARAAPEPGERRPFGYYYDDGTGYELYRPEEDEEEEEMKDAAQDAPAGEASVEERQDEEEATDDSV